MINKRPYCEIILSGNTYFGLLDTGAAISAIDEIEFDKINGRRIFKQNQLQPTLNITAANGGNISVVGLYRIPIEIRKKSINVEIYVVKNLSSKLILGMDFMTKANINIDVAKTIVSVNGKTICTQFFHEREIRTTPTTVTQTRRTGSCTMRRQIPAHSIAKISIKLNGEPNGEMYLTETENPYDDLIVYDTIGEADEHGRTQIFVGNRGADPIDISRGIPICEAIATKDFSAPTLNEIKTEAEKKPRPKPKPLEGEEARKFLERITLKCPPEYRVKYHQLFLKYHHIFSKDEYDLGWTDKVSHRITLEHNRPINTKQFKIPMPHQEIIQEFVDDMLDRKLIEVSRSRYNSPIFCVKKKNGSWRPVVDLRAINQATVEDFYSIRDIKSCIDEIGRAQSTVFSSMDLSKGFFQQNLAKESRPYTSFTVPGLGSFQFTVSCFGSHGAPSSFSYLMTEVLRNAKNLISFIDDVLAHTRNHENQLATLDVCFGRLEDYNLKLSIEKSTFGASETEYLGFKITSNGILPGTDKTKAVKEFPPPKTVKQIRQFVGLASFFRDHIRDFSRISGYLTALTRKTSDWKGGELPSNALVAFRRLQELLINEPIISYARNDLPFRLYCDASMGTTEKNGHKISGGLGAVLTQIHEDKKERVVGYASRKLKTHEENYPAYLLEMLAVTFGCEHFHHYLYGQRKFIVYSDHRPLSKLNKVHVKTQGRLQEMLLEYNYEIVYRKGEDQEAADFLSRNAVEAVETRPKVTFEENDDLLNFQNYTKEEIEKLQADDDVCQDITEFINNNATRIDHERLGKITRNKNNLEMDDDGILWWVDKEERQKLLIVPVKFIRDIISRAHDSQIGGHRDLEKTMERIKRVYWWLTMRRDISEYIKCCEACQRKNGPKSNDDLKYPLQPLKIPTRFNERVHADLLGPLRSSTPNKYVLVMSDAFSKWLEIVPIPDKSAETVAKGIYETWMCRNSPMDILVTDNGKEFKNKVMEELCKNNGVIQRFTSPYHPQSNAQCERQNRTILSYLKTFVDATTLNWESKLAPCQYSYNSQVHQSTKKSPYFARHLQSPTVPFRQISTPASKYSDTWANEALLLQQDVWGEIHDNLTKAAEVQKYQHDKNVKERKFEAGDLICVKDETPKIGKNAKLTTKWIGPFVITKTAGDTNVMIRKSPKGKEQLVNNSRIKLYHSLPPNYDSGHLNRKPEAPDNQEDPGEQVNPAAGRRIPFGQSPPSPPPPKSPDDGSTRSSSTGSERLYPTLPPVDPTDHVMSDDSDDTLTSKQSWTRDEKPSDGTSINTEKWVRNVPQASTPVTTSVGSDEVFEPSAPETEGKSVANWKKWTKGLGRGLPWNKESKPVKRTGSQYSMLPPEGTKKRVCEECLKDPIYEYRE